MKAFDKDLEKFTQETENSKTYLRFLLQKCEDACELSWTTGYAVDYFKSRLKLELKRLNVDVNIRELIGNLSHKHNMSAEPNRELKKIANRYARNKKLVNLVASASFDAIRDGHECLRVIEEVCAPCARDLRAYIKTYEYVVFER